MVLRKKWCLSVAVFVLGMGMAVLAVAAEAKKQERLHGLLFPEVIAKVNGVELDSNFIKFEFNRVMTHVKQPIDVREKIKIARDIIDREVVRELVSQSGKTKGIQIPSETIDQEVAALTKLYDNEQEFSAALKERQITEEDVKKAIRIDAMARELLDQQIKGKVKISDEDVKNFYEDNKSQFLRPESFRASHIFVAIYPLDVIKTTPRQELEAKKEEYTESAKKNIHEILTKIKAGEDFSELAKQHSQDKGSRENGGDLDFMYKGVFDPAFDEAVSKLKPGEVSDVVQTSYGFHIIKLMETRPEEQAQFSDMKGSIQQHLFNERAKKIVQNYLGNLRDQAKIETFFK
jgi:parvulin-like peptidyl-prolyl isomerase